MRTQNGAIVGDIEQHAVLFGLLAKHAVNAPGGRGASAINEGVLAYGRERGQRMAERALADKEPLNLVNYHAYGELPNSMNAQMVAGFGQTSPTLQTVITSCAWLKAWEKYDLLEYGKLYCTGIDNSVVSGFCSVLACTPLRLMSWGSDTCILDWGQPLSDEESAALALKRDQLADSCKRDFNYHIAHLLHTVGKHISALVEKGDQAVQAAVDDYIRLFGQGAYDAIKGLYPLPAEDPDQI